VALADDRILVNHSSPRSIALALARAGFAGSVVTVGAPELPQTVGARNALSNAFRRGIYAAARLPGGVHTPLALNLQAYATRL
jgi:hypothetical protein